MSDASQIARKLDEFANLQPPYPNWLEGGRADQGLDYCEPCAEKAVAEGRGDEVAGGYDRSESDGCRHCEGCGCLLDYWLTRHGVLFELEHFKDCPPTAPLSAETAFHIARMVDSIDEVGTPEAAAILQIAETALATIDKTRPEAEG